MATQSAQQVSVGLLSLVAGGIALLLFSIPYVGILSVPIAVLGLLMAVLEFMTPEPVERNVGVASGGAIVCVLALLVAAIRPFFSGDVKEIAQAAPRVSSPQSIPFPSGRDLRLVPAATNPKPANEPVEWTDASTAAAKQGELAVSVASVIDQPLELTSGGETRLSPDATLTIHVQVVLTGTARTVDFQSWGSASFGDARHKPSLADNSGRELQMRVFDAGTDVVGQPRPRGLYPKFQADDFLNFEAPADGVEFLRLELPASAFGGTGKLRFQIPKSMIEVREKDVPPIAPTVAPNFPP